MTWRYFALAGALPVLWPLLGCPVSVPSSLEFEFKCAQDSECDRGYVCDPVRSVCVAANQITPPHDAGQDASTDAAADAGETADAGRDAARSDAIAADAASADVSADVTTFDAAADAASADAVADATAADATRDAARADVVGDATVADGADDASALDAGSADAAVIDAARPDTGPVNTPPVITVPARRLLVYPSSASQSYTSSIELEILDAEGDAPFGLTLVGGHGGCSVSGTSLHFTAPPDFHGDTECTVEATDSGSPPATSLPAVVGVEVVYPYVSCYWVHADSDLATLGVGVSDGRYLIDPDGQVGTDPFDAWCDMSSAGGGWTLALRARSGDGYADYDNAYWTDVADHLSPNPAPVFDVTEKYQPFNTLAFSELLVGMVAEADITDPNAPVFSYLQRDLPAAPLLQVFQQNERISAPWSQLDRDQWIALIPGATLQPNCNREGLNSLPDGGRRVRVGISSNENGDCGSNNSHIGIGSDGYCGGEAYVGVSTCSNSGDDIDIRAFAVVYLRDSAIVSQTVRRSCMAHRLAGETADGLYIVDIDDAGDNRRPIASYCDMTTLGGGWTLVATNDDWGYWDWDMPWDSRTFASPPSLDEDYKSAAYHGLTIHDIMFASSEAVPQWALYQNFGEGSFSVGGRVADIGGPRCPMDSANVFHFSDGDLQDQDLCDRALYVSPYDMDGNLDQCNQDEDVSGPAWSVDVNGGCPLDDPLESSFIEAGPESPFGDAAVQIWARETDFSGLGAASSCQQHYDLGRVISGTYALDLPAGRRNWYCLMTDSGEGWMRIADLDRGHDDNCPGGLQNQEWPRTCGREAWDGNYVRGAQFNSASFVYQQVRGYVRAIQGGSPDGFGHGDGDIDARYVDGVAITHGPSAGRTHIWTYAIGFTEVQDEYNACPCRGGTAPPAFVGDDFYCDTARASGVNDGVWYHDNPLFDDISPSACYTGGDPAWFERALPSPTADPVQVRLIANENTDNEEIGLTRLELYVR